MHTTLAQDLQPGTRLDRRSRVEDVLTRGERVLVRVVHPGTKLRSLRIYALDERVRIN